jgi:3-methyladenine DNA glycosylase AlkD
MGTLTPAGSAGTASVTRSVMADLEAKGSEKTRKTYARHGVPVGRMFGVSVAELKVIAKTIKKQQAVALELYATGNQDAMYLAGMVADGSLMSEAELNAWADGAAQLNMISEYTVPWVAVENVHGCALAMEWIASKKEHVASSGWCTYSGLMAITSDDNLDLGEIEGLLNRVVREIDGAQNRVRYTMNNFVISVGSYVKPLLKQAKAAARAIGAVQVDVGDTACDVRLALAQIEKVEVAGRVRVKKKTIRC